MLANRAFLDYALGSWHLAFSRREGWLIKRQSIPLRLTKCQMLSAKSCLYRFAWTGGPPFRAFCGGWGLDNYRFAWPRAIFFTLRFFDPRA